MSEPIPAVIQRGPFDVLGIVVRVRRGTESPDLFSGIWSEFESHRQEILVGAAGVRFYGVRFPTMEEDVTEYLAGMVVTGKAPTPGKLQKRTVPGGRFAVFECPVTAIGKTYRHIFTVWLEGASVRCDSSRAVFEEYPESTSDQPVRIHIPVH